MFAAENRLNSKYEPTWPKMTSVGLNWAKKGLNWASIDSILTKNDLSVSK